MQSLIVCLLLVSVVPLSAAFGFGRRTYYINVQGNFKCALPQKVSTRTTKVTTEVVKKVTVTVPTTLEIKQVTLPTTVIAKLVPTTTSKPTTEKSIETTAVKIQKTEATTLPTTPATLKATSPKTEAATSTAAGVEATLPATQPATTLKTEAATSTEAGVEATLPATQPATTLKTEAATSTEAEVEDETPALPTTVVAKEESEENVTPSRPRRLRRAAVKKEDLPNLVVTNQHVHIAMQLQETDRDGRDNEFVNINSTVGEHFEMVAKETEWGTVEFYVNVNHNCTETGEMMCFRWNVPEAVLRDSAEEAKSRPYDFTQETGSSSNLFFLQTAGKKCEK